MIQIGVQTGGADYASVEDSYRIISEAGFDAADANINRVMSFDSIMNRTVFQAFQGSDRDCLPLFEPWRKGAQTYRVDNYQAHSIFPCYTLDGQGEEYNGFLLQALKKNIMACDYINCRNLIIHPAFCDYEHRMDPKAEWEINIERYAALIPEARKHGVTICLENMFVVSRGKILEACCSDIETSCRYIDTLNALAGEKRFAFCLDTGHLLLLGKHIKQAMIQLGGRISAFHIHDNDGRNDRHIAPYMGIQDWDAFVEGLRAIRFDRTMCFETANIWRAFDRDLCPDVMKLIAKTGRMFAARAQNIQCLPMEPIT